MNTLEIAAGLLNRAKYIIENQGATELKAALKTPERDLAKPNQLLATARTIGVLIDQLESVTKPQP